MRNLSLTRLAGALALAASAAVFSVGATVASASTDHEPPLITLLDDDGRPMPPLPSAVPADPAARPRGGLYASASQARDLERALGNGVLSVTVPCCGNPALEQALRSARERQARAGLPNTAPVLVRGDDLPLAARAVERLVAAGHTRVWLVTP